MLDHGNKFMCCVYNRIKMESSETAWAGGRPRNALAREYTVDYPKTLTTDILFPNHNRVSNSLAVSESYFSNAALHAIRLSAISRLVKWLAIDNRRECARSIENVRHRIHDDMEYPRTCFLARNHRPGPADIRVPVKFVFPDIRRLDCELNVLPSVQEVCAVIRIGSIVHSYATDGRGAYNSEMGNAGHFSLESVCAGLESWQ